MDEQHTKDVLVRTVASLVIGVAQAMMLDPGPFDDEDLQIVSKFFREVSEGLDKIRKYDGTPAMIDDIIERSKGFKK